MFGVENGNMILKNKNGNTSVKSKNSIDISLKSPVDQSKRSKGSNPSIGLPD